MSERLPPFTVEHVSTRKGVRRVPGGGIIEEHVEILNLHFVPPHPIECERPKSELRATVAREVIGAIRTNCAILQLAGQPITMEALLENIDPNNYEGYTQDMENIMAKVDERT